MTRRTLLQSLLGLVCCGFSKTPVKAEPPEPASEQNRRIMRAMRELSRNGVDHFVVNDNLYERLDGICREQRANLGADAVDNGHICFRGRRIYRTPKGLTGIPL